MSASSAPKHAAIPVESLVAALHDGWVVAKRNLIRIKRLPDLLIFSTIQPIMFVENGDIVTRGVIGRPCAVVGREPYCNIVLSDPAVSSRHAFLQVIGGQVFVADLDSRSGTRWSDKSRPDGWLLPDVPIRIGPFRLRLTAPVSDASVPFDPAFHPLLAGTQPRGYPSVAIDFRNGKVAQTRWAVNRTVTLIGRARSCKINLTSDDVSLFHGYYLLTPDGVWVVDMYGRGGILVNGRPHRYARLEHGDEVRIGKFLMGVSYEDGVNRPETARVPASLAYPDELNGFPDGLVEPIPTQPAIFAQGSPVSSDPITPPGPGDVVPVPAAPPVPSIDQFQQMMEKMVAQLGKAHQVQIAALEREMSKLTALTEELKKQQAKLPPNPKPAGPAAPKARPANPPAPAERAAKPPVRSATPTVPSPVKPATPTVQPPLSREKQSVSPTDSEMHQSLVYERIAALHAERQSIWQRLMSMVSSKPSGE